MLFANAKLRYIVFALTCRYILLLIYKTSRGESPRFRSKQDLRQRHKQLQTQTYSFIAKRGAKGTFPEENQESCRRSKLLVYNVVAKNQSELSGKNKEWSV